MENLLKEVKNRFTLFPIQYPKIYEFFQLHEAGFWTTEEIDLKKDIVDWTENLNENERFFIKNVLAFFAASDGIVNENLVLNFYNNIQIPEARAYYTMQMLMETIHCVRGDTIILTTEGHFKIKDLVGKKCNVWNGEEWSQVEPVKTSDKATMFNVVLDNGLNLHCTSKHKWYVINEDISPETKMVYTEYLIPGKDKIRYRIPILDNNTDMTFLIDPFRLGYKYHSDYDEKNIKNVFNWPFEARIQWLKGFFSYIKNTLDNLRVTSSDNLVLRATNDNIYKMKEVPCCFQDIAYMLLITGVEKTYDYIKNLKIEEINDLLNFSLDKKPSFIELELTIKKVYISGYDEESYCFEEPKRHMGVFNGILTGQSQTYSVLIDTFIKDLDEKDKLFNAISNIPAIEKKANWALKWISSQQIEQDNALETYLNTKKLSDLENLIDVMVKHKKDMVFKNKTFIQQLIAFVIVEGLFFSGSFCAIFWLKNRGLMPGLCFSNELISRDESLHCQMGIYLYSLVENKLSEEYVHNIFKESVEIEKEFITQSLPVSLIGMNSEKMSQYIEYVADRLLYDLGYNKLFGVKTCPFSFMELLSFSGENSKVNFFEKRNADYQKAGIGKTQNEMKITFQDEF